MRSNVETMKQYGGQREHFERNVRARRHSSHRSAAGSDNWRDNNGARYRATEWHHYRFNMASHRARHCITQRCAAALPGVDTGRVAAGQPVQGISRQIAFRDIERVLFD